MNGKQKLIGAVGLVLVVLLGLVFVPWRFSGQAWFPGGGEAQRIELDARRHAPIFLPPEVDAAELGLGIPDERFQVQVRAELDWRPWLLRIVAIVALTLIAMRLTGRRRRS